MHADPENLRAWRLFLFLYRCANSAKSKKKQAKTSGVTRKRSERKGAYMSIDLYKHNQDAYNAALSMLSRTGKAAVIHPTGTGKSFIGFKLCEDMPAETVCWLSPSEYIFNTQIENLKAASDGYVPENVVFLTYAKLMNMSDEAIDEIKPGYIILDEFHRCGAEMWGQGVRKLLKAYPDVPILGLSATNIRYLDNQRNMADELFDGNVASEITLGEAIVRGILNAPKYVLSVFSYQSDLEKYERRVKRNKNKAVRDAATEYLEALRRSLDKADGLEDIFERHMEEKNGKYIVFCANFEHLTDMVKRSKKWFSKVDRSPNVYIAYSDDPSTSKEFEDFKQDKSDHLKLLFCIDMLNEGIHVEDISGVILLRPTVSPIIYKQQIGRALSASKKKNAVIFDIVLNIENLYSIGAVEEEMEIATAYYRSLGEGDEIVNERFKVIDEVRDCRMLFEKLNDTLTASWDVMYSYAKEYYTEYGSLNVPARYVTAEGYSLGRWIVNQRGIRNGTVNGKLTKDQIQKLDLIGMVWGMSNDISWNRNFEEAKKYYEANGNLNVPAKYVSGSGVALGSWLSYLRVWEKSGVHRKYLTAERIAALNSIGMIWDVLDYYWENNFLAAFNYYRENGNLNVPSKFVTKDGIRLGEWLARVRKLRIGECKGTPLTSDQISRLDAIGMVWKNTADMKWERAYLAVKKYFEENGDLNVPAGVRSDDGLALKAWIHNQRKRFHAGNLEVERKILLDSIGMVWDLPDPWMIRLELVVNYFKKNGNIEIPQSYSENGVWLGKWLARQLKCYKNGTLTDMQKNLLEELLTASSDNKSAVTDTHKRKPIYTNIVYAQEKRTS